MHKKVLSIALLEALLSFSHKNASTEIFTTLDRTEESNFTLISSDNDIYFEKHESLKTCYSFDLSPEEYILFPNKTAFVPNYKRMYEEHSYILHDDHLRICPPPEVFEEDLVLSSTAPVSLRNFSKLGLGVSMVFLFIHIVVFALVPNLKSLHEWNLASLCVSLFVSYFILLCFDISYVQYSAGFCIATAVLTLFFFFASLLWMNIISFDIFRSIRIAVKNLSITNKVIVLHNKKFKMKRYVINNFISWGIALVFTVAAIIADNVQGIDKSIKPHFKTHCWFKTKYSFLLYFGIPISVLIVLNFILFGFTACTIYLNRSQLRIEQMKKDHCMIRQHYLIFLKLAIITGATWITGVLALVLNFIWLWNLFIVMHILQGSFIFIAFTCSEKVRKHLKSTLFRERTTAEGMQLEPSFKSYLRFSKFTKKDLNIPLDTQIKLVPCYR
ncbi:g-protein coupled receptor Mth2 [Nephila pilipes]|uniref:G-protein coupled receptor Mth2 n=1 Tax=Nephila pilipes TaxID=299642 RepID=A0A8X6TIA2_NEPPI|nr:g-protein coupled receptor Mth2 [Nephila pilipes]